MIGSDNRFALSDRKFGFTFTVFFLVLSGVGWLVFDRLSMRALVTAGVLATVSLIYPALLWPVNRFWCGCVAPRIAVLNNRIALGLFFFVVLTPAAFVMRRFGYDPMKRRLSDSRESYFDPVERQATAENFREVY